MNWSTYAPLANIAAQTSAEDARSVPVSKWHENVGEPTVADAILDGLVHNAHKLVLKGPSRRKEDSSEK